MEKSMTSPTKIEDFEDLTWDGLIELCKEKDEKLSLAGVFGLELQKQLSDANAHIEELRSQHEAELEKYVQEAFETKNRLDAKEKLLVSQQIELEEVHKNNLLQKNNAIEEVEAAYKKEISSLRKEKEHQHKDLEQAHLNNQHILDQNNCLQERISELQNEVNKFRDNSADNILDSFDHNEEICVLTDQVEKYSQRVTKLQNENHMLKLELTSKCTEAESSQRELEESEAKATSYFNHLQIAREESTELRVELEALKNEMDNQGHQQKGNSLFGEVEDQRKEMEKKLKSFQIKFDSLSKAYAFLVNQNQSMKVQIASLLQLNSGKADVDRINHLERALSQANAEIKSLTAKNKEFDKNQPSEDSWRTLAKSLPDFESNRHMFDYLMIEMKENKEKLKKISEENDHLSLMKIAESEKLMKSEQKLYETDLQAGKFRNENLRLRLKLEETKNKMVEEVQRRIMIEKKFNYDSKHDIVPLGAVNVNKSLHLKSQPVPPTFAKARKETEEARINAPSRNSFDKKKEKKLNADIEASLNQYRNDEKENCLYKEREASLSNTDQIPEKHVRKVSFRSETETIPEVVDRPNIEASKDLKLTMKKSIKSSNSVSKTPIIDNNTKLNGNPTSVLKRKGLTNLGNVPVFSTTPATSNHDTSRPVFDVSDNLNDDPQCAMQ